MAETLKSFIKYALSYSKSVEHEFQTDKEYKDTVEIQRRISLLEYADAVQRVALRKLFAQ